jgi:predicted nucleic acid-binding protein
MIVVADAGPVNYLVLSGQLDLVHDLYRTLLLPLAVHREPHQSTVKSKFAILVGGPGRVFSPRVILE